MYGFRCVRWIILFLLNTYLNLTGEPVTFTMPGTVWCGPGNDSTSIYDLGFFTSTDQCCRQHDLCPKYLEPKSTGYGLINDDPYTRTLCDCDETFMQCLNNINDTLTNDIAARFITFVYFTLLKDRCFTKKKLINGYRKKFINLNKAVLIPKLTY
ncbi:hypothetical protein PGB90_005183 [Kerria lacca]